MKIALKFFITVLTLSSVLLLAFTRRDGDPLTKLTATLQRWTDSIPQEKVYLHMDKPYYALGDTMWFKGYLTIGAHHQLSALSGAMYVELINEKDSLLQQFKLPVTSGMVMGNFILKDDYHQGSYRIRAYTQWMRNAGEDYFYDHTFTVGDVVGGEVAAKADFSYVDDKGKKVLTAILNYTNNEGKALGDKAVRFEIWTKQKSLWQQNAKTDALGSLRITIPDDIKQHPDGAYIHTTIENGKSTIVRDFPVKATLSQSDVQFFPESGTLVNGITSKVAFKAVGIEGLGINIKGNITDNDNKEVAKLETLHAGMGSFFLNPVAGKAYIANIVFQDGSTKNIALPAAIDQGYVLDVHQLADSVLVRVHASGSLLGSSVNLIAHSSGQTIFTSPLKIEKPLTAIWLDKKAFPTGIAQFTLFSSAGEPLNERISFIRNTDLMQLDIKTAKSSYNSKERVQVHLQAKDGKGEPAIGNFSVSVVDEKKIPFDETNESTIFSNILLTSDLKGYVEQPNYYFFKTGDEVDRALDNLMLTQGYRRFTWKELSNTVTTKPQYPAEGLGTNFSGKVTSLTNKPVQNASVMLLALKAGVTKVTTSDADGRFKFPGYFLTDSNKITIQARNGKSSKVLVVMDSIPKTTINHNPNLPDVSTDVNTTLKAYLDNVRQEDDAYEKMGLLDRVHRLREVKIRAIKPDPLKNYAQQWGPMRPDWQTEQTYYPKNLDKFGLLGMGLEGYLHKVEFVGRWIDHQLIPMYPHKFERGHLVPMGVVLDGRSLGPTEAAGMFDGSQLDPTDVIRVDVMESTLYLYTKPEDQKRRSYTPSIVNFVPKGFNKVREFYSPRYGRPGNAAKQPDLRTTIFWSPYLKTDSTGNTAFNFYNADGPGNYRVVIEGINAAGQLGRAVYRYTVNAAGGTIATPPVDKSLVRITAPLDSFNKRLPIEKAYLHLDKPYYNTGDTLWFKSYLLDRVNLTASHLSGLEYIEIVDDSAQVMRRVSVNVKDGLAWGQIPLLPAIFKEGSYTLRAYTNWMQNFGGDYIFTHHFYIGVPAADAWLVNSAAKLQKVGDKEQVQVNLKLTKANNPLTPVAAKKVEVKLFVDWHYVLKQEMQTGADGTLNLSNEIGSKVAGQQVRVQITSLDKADNFKVVQVPLQLNRDQNIDLQFLPEGGHLVAGLNSTVGFKAIAEDGTGADVLGGIFDSKDNQVVSFQPLHKGMGTFSFTPHAGETYTARLSQPIAKSYPLPKIQPTGTVMHVYNPELGNDLKVDIAGTSSLPTDSAFFVVGTSRGVVYYSQKVDLAHPSLAVAKNLFPTGIARLTLFEGTTPLNERAVFIDNGDKLQIKVRPNKASYVKRDSVSLDIQVTDQGGMPVQGNFSLAVTDNSQVKPDSLGNYSIVPYLMLNAELKGNLESPGYYINRKNKQAWQALDNLMLTQGWIGYDWKDVFAPAGPVKYQAEKEFKITGVVRNIANKPAKNETVLISSQKPAFITTAVSDSTGRYVFDHLPVIDSGSFFLQANNAKGRHVSFGSITVDNKFKPISLPAHIDLPATPWYVNTDSQQLNYVQKQAEKIKDDIKLSGRVLKEVQIKDKKIIKDSRFALGPGQSDMAFDEEDIKASATNNLYELLKQKIPGFRVLGARLINYPENGQVLGRNIATVKFLGKGLPPGAKADPMQEKVAIPLIAFNGYEIMLRMNGGPVVINVDIPDVAIEDVQLEKIAIESTYPGRPYREYSVLAPREDVIEALKEYKIPGLTGLEVAYSRKYTNRVAAARWPGEDIALLELTTKNGIYSYRDKAPGTTTYRPLPVLHPQQFYSPKYSVASPVTVPDYRPTIFWEPNINTDNYGHAKVSFYTSDIKSSYTVTISGFDFAGNIGDHIFNLNLPHPNETN